MKLSLSGIYEAAPTLTFSIPTLLLPFQVQITPSPPCLQLSTFRVETDKSNYIFV